MAYTLTSNTDTTAIATWGSTAERFAITFTTLGAGTVSTVDFCIGVGSGTPTGIACEIWNDSAGSPGSSVAVSNTRSVSGAGSRHTFTFAAPVNVSATTTYWVGINLASLSGGTVVNCGQASAGTQTDKYSSDSGASWSAAQPWEMNYSFQVDEAAAPSGRDGRFLTLSGVGQ